MKITADQLETIETIAEDVDGGIRLQYSGRGMFGKTCLGVVCEDAALCLEVAGSYGIKGGVVDAMGLQSIVYWPRLSMDDDKKKETV